MSSDADKRYAKYKSDYARVWQACEVLPSRRREVDTSVSRMLANKFRYQGIERDTGVPWWVVAIIHKMECNLDFNKHLHNGDSLQKRTWQVPAGRPKTHAGPFTWEESAIDALEYDGVTKVRDWTVERVAFVFETFNGFGYRKLGINSPYLWSFSNQYARGKFVRDGAYDPNAVSQQSGAMVLLKALMDRDRSIVLRSSVGSVPDIVPDENEKLPKADDKKLKDSLTLYGLIMAGVSYVVSLVADAFGWIGSATTDLIKEVIELAQESQSLLAPLSEVAAKVGLNWSGIVGALFVFGLIVAAIARLTAHWQKRIG